MNTIRLWINHQQVQAESGQTILEAAEQAGIVIPRLCYHPAVKASGSCRLCAVEIDGYRGLPAACSTPVVEGMKVQTATAKVEEFRREMLRLILQGHPRECLGCPRNGTCELQQLVAAVGIDFPYLAPTTERPPVKPAGAYFERDYGLCVRCGRCVRVCHEVRGAKAIVFREIAGRQEVSTAFDRPLEEVGCQFCGACVDVCPVGALRERLEPYAGEARRQMLEVCASLTNIVMDLYRKELPRTWQSSLCPMCGAGCRMMFELTEAGQIVQIKPHPAGAANRGQACVQGRFLLKGCLQSPDRLQLPEVRDHETLRAATWDQALNTVADRLRAYGPGQVAVVSDGRASNEELYLLQKFARSVLNTDVVGCLTPPGHLQCAEALRHNLGVTAATASLEDLGEAGCIFAIGLNPAATHPIAGTHLRGAVLNGARLVVASPYHTATARYADLHLSYLPGSETALVAGLLKLLIDSNKIDRAFAAQYSYALEDLKKSLKPYDLESAAKATGVHAETLAEAACLLGEASTVSILYGPGLVQAKGVAEVMQGLLTLAQLKGSLGKAGCGIMPLYGSGNLQGAWDMGMAPHLLPGQRLKSDADAPADVLEAIAGGKVKALYLVMENLEGAALDALRPHLEKLEFLVIQAVREPSIAADVVLPMAATAEKRGTLTSADRRVQSFAPILAPPGEARPLQPVLCELAKRLGADGFDYDNEAAVLTEIQRQVPFYAGVSLERGSVRWPCPDREHAGTSTLFVDRQPEWRGWKPAPLEIGRGVPDKEFPFRVLSKELLQPFLLGPVLAPESMALYRTDGKIEMNPADAFGMGFSPGENIRLVTPAGACEGQLLMNQLLPAKVVVVPLQNMQAILPVENPDGRMLAARVESTQQERG